MEVRLKVMVGKSAGKEIGVPVSRFLIGRSDDCHLRPKSDSISRNHCAILTREDHVVVRDLNSRNGTFLNGERVTQDTEVDSGDQLQIGKLEFEVLVKGAPIPKPKAVGTPEATIKAPDSLEFDVSEWLQEADASEKTKRVAEPETRQFQLDETDRVALANAEEKTEDVPAQRPEKKEPGKLPTRPDSPNTSRDAAADMLKKFFNNR